MGHAVCGAALQELVFEGRHQRVDLLADRLAEVVRLGRRETGQLLGDLHVLLLVDADPVGGLGDRLQPLVDVRHRFLAVLSLRVAGDVAHRPGPVERDERDQVLELGRLHLPQCLAHPGRLELEDAHRVTFGEHRVRLRVVRGDLLVREPADQLVGLLDHVQVPEAQEVHLQEPERLDVPHPELRHDLLVGALLLERDVFDERPVADDDSGGVDRVVADEPLERLREVDDLTHLRLGVVRLPELGARLERVLEVDLRALRDHLRDPVDLAVRDLEHATGVPDRCPGEHGAEGDDLRDPVATVLLLDVVDHPVAAGDSEVDVHVGH